MATLPLLTWIGNAAAALLGRKGAVTRQAQQAGCSRRTVKVHHALRQAQAPGPTRGALPREVQQHRQENRQLWGWLAEALDCPRPKQRQFAVTAPAMGLSLRQARSLLAILLPPARCPATTPGPYSRWGPGSWSNNCQPQHLRDETMPSAVRFRSSPPGRSGGTRLRRGRLPVRPLPPDGGPAQNLAPSETVSGFHFPSRCQGWRDVGRLA